MRRLVVPEEELRGSREDGDTASRAVAIDSKGGSELLELHLWLLVHSLETSGPSPMRIVAVFHPAGDPPSRAYEADE
jgi:hypothetical protein